MVTIINSSTKLTALPPITEKYFVMDNEKGLNIYKSIIHRKITFLGDKFYFSNG